MPRTRNVLCIVASLALALNCACALVFYLFEPASVRSSSAAPAPQSSDNGVIYLDQGWSQTVREAYYHISQGSTVIPYDIFLNLEVADSQELFRSDANSDRYGLIPEAANPETNPDVLPVGLNKTMTTEGPWKGEEVGLNCAACHETELT